jgi:drug/metabolite transporter (DMT)-like permease
MTLSPTLRGIICMVLACITFVSCDSFLKLMLREVPPLQTLVLRGISATFWCLLLIVGTGQLKHVPKAFGLWTILRSLCEAVAVTAFILALARVPLADISAIYQIAPLLVLGGASIIWHEQVGALRWLLIGLGLAGALMVAQPGSSGASPYAMLGFVTAMGSAARDLLSRRVPYEVPGLVITLTIILAVLLVSTLNTMLFETWVPVSRPVVWYSLGSGFFVMLGHLFVFLSFRFASARAVAPFYYGITLCAVVFGALFFNEWPNTFAVFGILMIIGCGLGVLVLEQREKLT